MSGLTIQNRQICETNHSHLVSFSSVGELDQLRELARGASLEIFQLEKGIMQGTLAHVELGVSSVHSNSFSLAARGIGALSPQRWTFVVFSSQVDGSFNSRILLPQNILCYRPGSEFEGTIKGSFQDWIFTVEEAALRSVVQRLFALDLPAFASTCNFLRPEPQRLLNLRRFAQSIIGMVQDVPESFSSSRFRTALQGELLEQLAQIVVSGKGAADVRSRAVISHAQVVRLAENYLATQLDGPVLLSDLCAAAGVSIRTLRNAFQSVLGVSPNTYLKFRRLQLVRTQLELPTTANTTVTSIALKSGFSHLGHFARDYRRFFDECPSQTLARTSQKVRR